jgi:hypothetical protein
MKNKYFFLILLLFATCQSIYAKEPQAFSISNALNVKQKSSSDFDKTRLIFGPGFGVGVANRSFNINFNPSIGYALTDNFNVGFGLGFNYFQTSYDYNNKRTGQVETFRRRLDAYSINLFARYIVANMFFVGIEPEINNTKYIKGDPSFDATGKVVEKYGRLTVPSFLIGGGYGQRYDDLGYYYFMAMYDVAQNPNAFQYYQTLAIKAGVMIQLFRK